MHPDQHPESPPVAGGGGAVAAGGPTPRRRGPGRVVGISAAVVLLLLVVLAVGLELGLRHSLGDRLQREATSSLGAPAEVELGGLALPSIVTKELSEVHITSAGTTPSPGDSQGEFLPALDLTAHGVREEDGHSHLDDVGGTVSMTDEQLARAATRRTGGSGGGLSGLTEVQNVTSDPANGTLKADIGGLAEAVVRPVLKNGKVELEAQSASFLGMQVPTNLLGGTVSMMDDVTSRLPEGVDITGVTVVDGGLELTLSGTDVVLDEKG